MRSGHSAGGSGGGIVSLGAVIACSPRSPRVCVRPSQSQSCSAFCSGRERVTRVKKLSSVLFCSASPVFLLFSASYILCGKVGRLAMFDRRKKLLDFAKGNGRGRGALG